MADIDLSPCFKNGLRPFPTLPRNALFCETLKNLQCSEKLGKPLQTLTYPVGFQADVGTWPHFQVHRAENVALVTSASAVYPVTISSLTTGSALSLFKADDAGKSYTISGGGCWRLTAFQDIWLLTNGSNIVMKLPHAEGSVVTGVAAATLGAQFIGNWNNRLVLGGLSGTALTSDAFADIFNVWLNSEHKRVVTSSQDTFDTSWVIVGPDLGGDNTVPLAAIFAWLGLSCQDTPTGASVDSGNGGDFGNQPATDGVTVVSSDAGDTAVLTITGHTGGTVATEDITLNGTTPVASTEVNWTDILGVEVKTGTLAGTVTVKETSGGLTITTLAPAATSAGVLTDGGSGYNQQLEVVADGASTAYVYVVGLKAGDGSALTSIVQLNGTTAVALGTSEWQSVTKIYVGAAAAARTVTVRTIPNAGVFDLYYDKFEQDVRFWAENGMLQFIPCRKIGPLRAGAQHGNDYLVYGRDGVMKLTELENEIMDQVSLDVGIVGRGALAGDDTEHAMVSTGGEIFMRGAQVRRFEWAEPVGDDGWFRLGYAEFVGTLDQDDTLMASFDPTERYYWFADDANCFGLSRTGLYRSLAVRPSSVIRLPGQTAALAAYKTGDVDVEFITHMGDGQRSERWIIQRVDIRTSDTAADPDDRWQIGFYARLDKSAAFTEFAVQPVDRRGRVNPTLSVVDYKVKGTANDRTKVDVDALGIWIGTGNPSMGAWLGS